MRGRDGRSWSSLDGRFVADDLWILPAVWKTRSNGREGRVWPPSPRFPHRCGRRTRRPQAPQAFLILADIHDNASRISRTPDDQDGRRLTDKRRFAPTSVHLRRNPRSRSAESVFNFSGIRSWRKQEILGLTWEEIDMAGGVIRLSPGRSKTLVGRILPISPPIAEALARRRARRDPGSSLVFHRDGIPVRRWRTAWRTACQAAGVPTRFLHDCRRTAARNLIRANVPERVAMLLTGHKSRAIFDRYNIFTSRNCSTPGTNSSSISRNRRRRYQPASGPTRPDPPPRAPHHPSASYDAAPRKGARPGSRPRGGGGSGRTPPVGALRLAPRPHGRAGPRLGCRGRLRYQIETSQGAPPPHPCSNRNARMPLLGVIAAYAFTEDACARTVQKRDRGVDGPVMYHAADR